MRKVTYANLSELQENILFQGGGRAVLKQGFDWSMSASAAADDSDADVRTGEFGGAPAGGLFGNGLGLFGDDFLGARETGKPTGATATPRKRKRSPAKGVKESEAFVGECKEDCL